MHYKRSTVLMIQSKHLIQLMIQSKHLIQECTKYGIGIKFIWYIVLSILSEIFILIMKHDFYPNYEA